MRKMVLIAKLLAHLLSLLGLLLLFVLPVNEYEWAEDIIADPPVGADSDTGPGAFLIVLAISVVQLVIAKKTTSRLEKGAALVIVLAAVGMGIKFWR
ncbi:hypothetical protein OOT46_29250 [Aquabacterium sp. A7-Y]|uniref:hypothetical protein n=1 Tax=Aquabacterium sp. A7-Y TaxID=1349605 RepID=UPI00223DA294|nr:hypothetical protein [Aquabacterium sp. A7-Y]MCW7541889.1 hypothetical protein [Aquabacterium sp. A7-Y]